MTVTGAVQVTATLQGELAVTGAVQVTATLQGELWLLLEQFK